MQLMIDETKTSFGLSLEALMGSVVSKSVIYLIQRWLEASEPPM